MTREEAIKYLEMMVDEYGRNFHPDDWYPKSFQEGIDKCFEILGDEIYDISLKLMDESIKSV